ncbi:hypothetical protein V3H41_17765 [Vibrio parahaemolyticus]|uniref:hypothetical protein n=1 Tax=Vibrio parahaemolyticus TaxID=670 RepID=UPI0008FC8B6A|nr:hypothetical protein [Vibrio parahaemolyticus]APC86888.1 hypothetical protein FORC22_1027 [Vibrio parahaemolyticus]
MVKPVENILVVAREGSDLDELSEALVVFGTIATSMVKRVKEGNGKAKISSVDLKIILDTQDAVNVIFDNFELYDLKTYNPLIWELLKINSLLK